VQIKKHGIKQSTICHHFRGGREGKYASKHSNIFENILEKSMGCTCNPSTWEAEAGGSRIGGQPQFYVVRVSKKKKRLEM
jgi:hypothetical protein